MCLLFVLLAHRGLFLCGHKGNCRECFFMRNLRTFVIPGLDLGTQVMCILSAIPCRVRTRHWLPRAVRIIVWKNHPARWAPRRRGEPAAFIITTIPSAVPIPLRQRRGMVCVHWPDCHVFLCLNNCNRDFLCYHFVNKIRGI